MSGPVATRNTCFALISAIEDDFRSLIVALGDPDGTGMDLLPSDVKDNALKRRASDLRMDSISSSVEEQDLLAYIDFSDIAKIIESRIATKMGAQGQWLTSIARKMVALTGTRNRVCHSRPLEMEDLPRVIDFSRELLEPSSPFSYPGVSSTIKRLADEPGWSLTIQIPSYWNVKSNIHHNLPVPEFDDTGFVGRQADRQNVLKLLKSHYPVVTIVGEGGIGKTALALRCLYDLLEDSIAPYDAIIWVSLKTAALTQAGVKNIAGSITSTLGLLSEVTKHLGPTTPTSRSEAEYIDEIAEYLELYRIIIAIDNLETISTGPLRDLILRIPSTSKLLLTSRVGLGEFEARYPLHGLEEKAAISLFRAHARILGVGALLKLDDGNVKGYCKRLFYNPLLIKWFIASVSRGSDPSAISNRDGSEFSSALSFCFQNLFDRLGKQELEVTSCLASARKPLTSAEIHFLMPNLPTHEIEFALMALHNSSLVSRTKQGTEGFEYVLSESASTFITKNSPPSAVFFKSIQDRLRDLRLVLTNESFRGDRYEYDPFFVRSGVGRDERICATYLRRALDLSWKFDFSGARIQVAEAKRLASHNGEAWRISALVEEHAKDQYKAFEDYEHAIDLDPKSRIAKYCFGMFLMTDMDDLERALSQFIAAEELDPAAAPILTAKAMALNRMGRFEESAKIHEILLPNLALRERRWRLTGADQAADCYRRWCHRSWEKKEYEEAALQARRSINIILDSAARGDIDEKLRQRTARVLNEALGKKELVVMPGLTEYLISTAEKIHDLGAGKSIPTSTEAVWALRSLELSQIDRERLLRLDRSQVGFGATSNGSTVPSANDQVLSGRQFGKVHNLSERFGFINCDNGHRWFFHRNFLRPDTLWDSLAVGSAVSFEIGQNSQGECAVDVGNA